MKKIIFILAAAMLAVSCSKPESGNKKEDARILQRARIRMEVKDNRKPAKTDIVGDSAAVKLLARYGYMLHSRYVRLDPRDDSAVWYGHTRERLLDVDHYDLVTRDTAECVFLFGYPLTFDYTNYDMNADGVMQGRPGTEVQGLLISDDNPVIVGFYDTIRNRYQDPLIPLAEQEPMVDWWECNTRCDTFGYIPQSMMDANRPLLEKFFKEGRYSEMEKIMKTGYTIYTCTGEEYRELVRLGLN